MPHIQQLDAHVADLIAAGEVVERPASVVKELVENAIDAGASAIVAEVRRGGMGLIRVTDDGCGIAPEDLPTAFFRHATSKLRQPEDLGKIGTLGFRGEALAAISAVSRVDILTRQPEAAAGAALHLEGGVSGNVEEAGAPEGTTIRVCDLFYNTPARLKFMRKDSAETAAVAGLMQHLSLSHPSISFKLIKDGVEALHTPGDGKLLSAIYAALGRDFAKGLLPVEGRGGEISVSGYVTLPLQGRGSRSAQVFFVNGRFIKSQLLTAALEEGYRNQLLKGKFPGCVLSVSLPVTAVDVNVHPAKTQVKFAREQDVFNAVYHTVLDRLQEKGMPSETPPSRSAIEPEADRKVRLADRTPARFMSYPAQSVRPKLPETTKHALSPPPPSVTVERPKTEPPSPPVHRTLPPAIPQQQPTQTALPMPETAPWRIAGEAFHTYIICESGDGQLWLIDKHAAHERINFDRLTASQEPPMRQTLLQPIVAELGREDASLLLENRLTLERLGFDCEDFGDGALLVRMIPSDMDPSSASSTLEELAEELRTGRSVEERREALLRTIACKAAIKGGWSSDESELRILVDKVQSGEVQYCPHGRPVAIRFTKQELEKLFKRT